MRIDFGKTVYEAARAKINISLDVLGLMPDGYHELDSVMVSLSLCDDVSVTLLKSGGTDVVIRGFTAPRNTAATAALRFFDALGLSGCTADIEIKKRIPVQAGLGGGSADAAAVLRALNVLCGGRRPFDRLREIGFFVGADVPFCVEGGTARAGGRGELLSPLRDFPDCGILLVKPAFSVSTAELYSKIDSVKIAERPDTGAVADAVGKGDLRGIAAKVCNVFEEVLSPDLREEIFAIKSRLLEFGALSSAMTGTGSAVFGLFEKIADASDARNMPWGTCEVFLCRPEK